VILGFALLWRYEMQPGDMGGAPSSWPAGAGIEPNDQSATLLMFVHPQCPCSRASLNELERLVARCGEQVDARVLFVLPEGAPSEWNESELWHAAGRIPHTVSQMDVGGTLAVRFGAETSGQVVLYDAGGRLRYRGGITGSRGHEGDNVGRSTVEELLLGRSDGETVPSQPVFGCPLESAAVEDRNGVQD